MSEPKSHLTALPPEIKLKIISFLDTNSKLSVRQCSKDLKNVVDSGPIHYGELTLFCKYYCVEVRMKIETNDRTFENLKHVEYKPLENGYSVNSGDYPVKDEEERIVEGGNHVEAAISQFMKLLRNPKVFVEKFTVTFLQSAHKALFLTSLQAALATLNRQISARKFAIIRFENLTDILHVLPFLKPGTLETLTLASDRHENRPLKLYNDDFQEILETEQWRKAKNFDLRECVLGIDLDKTDHFTELRYCRLDYDLKEAKRIIENMLRPDGWNFRSIKWIEFEDHQLVEYLTGPMKDDLGPNYKVSVEQGELVEDRRPETLRVLVEGPKRLEIEFESIDWADPSDCYEPLERRVFFRNLDAPELPTVGYEMKWRKEMEQRMEKRRADRAAERAKLMKNGVGPSQ